LNHDKDVLGMELHDAAALLEAEGLSFRICETMPPKPPKLPKLPESAESNAKGALRVIRVRQLSKGDGQIELTVCRI